jgi:hypothetical protein
VQTNTWYRKGASATGAISQSLSRSSINESLATSTPQIKLTECYHEKYADLKDPDTAALPDCLDIFLLKLTFYFVRLKK